MRTYELMTIHRPELAEEEVRSQLSALEEHLGQRGAKVGEIEVWGKRRFAYEIDHLSEGFYSVMTFEAEPDAAAELDRALSLADEVLRHKIVRPGE